MSMDIDSLTKFLASPSVLESIARDIWVSCPISNATDAEVDRWAEGKAREITAAILASHPDPGKRGHGDDEPCEWPPPDALTRVSDAAIPARGAGRAQIQL